MKTCPVCSTSNTDEARFCASCGSAFAAACANCGAALPDGARFCSSCGHRVDAPASAEERKVVTVLFADVTGFTNLGERLDAERLKDVMDAYFAAMREAIDAQGGTVEKFIGDAVMAVFGVPAAHEDDPIRALRAALGMRAQLVGLNETLSRSHGFTLEMRIGVNSGEVIARTEFQENVGMVTGDAVSVAARLEQVAEPGQVLVAERTARATRGFRFSEVAPLSLKGKAHPVRALLLVGDEGRAERGIPGLDAPLVGRETEMALLEALHTRVAGESRPHLITVYGDAGVGKSRLVAEFLQRLEGRETAPLIVSGRCMPYGEGVTYWPIAEILKGLAGIFDSDPPDLVVEKIRKLGRGLLTAEVAPDPVRAAAALAYTVGVEDPLVSFRDLAPRQVRLETHAAWRALFSALAEDRPVVVVIEDIHWADDAMLDLLEELAERLEASVMVVCPSRLELTQRRPTWGGGGRNFSSISLDPLTRDETGVLVDSLLSIADLPSNVHDQILERAEGNPFFVEEILRHLIDERRIVYVDGRWAAGADCEQIVIPDTVQGVLAARIDLLSAAEKRALQAAAVVGRNFWIGPVARLLDGDDPGVEDLLEALESRGLVRARLSSSMAGDREYVFRHVLTKDVAYEGIPRRDRGGAHERVARWIEETAGDRRAEFVDLLAHHYLQAFRAAEQDPRAVSAVTEELRAAAFENLIAASQSSVARFALPAAERTAQAAFDIARDPLERSRSLETLGRKYQLDYRGDLAWRHFVDAVEDRTAAEPENHRAIASLCASALEIPTRWPGSMDNRPSREEVARYLRVGGEHAEELGGDSVELVRMLTVEAFAIYAFPSTGGGEDRSLETGQAAAQMARRLGRPDLESAALDGAMSGWISRGVYNRTKRLLERRLELVDSISDPWEVGDIYSMAAWNGVCIGAYREAVAFADRGSVSTVEDVPGVVIHSLSWRAIALHRLGEWDECLTDVSLIEKQLGGRQPPYFGARPYAAAALVHEIRGNPSAADSLLSVLYALGAGKEEDVLTWGAWLAPLRVRRGDPEEALRLIEGTEKTPRADVIRAMNLETYCDVVASSGRWDRAEDVLTLSREFAAESDSATLTSAADVLEGRAAFAHGDAEGAVSLLTRGRDGLASFEVVWEAARCDLYLAEVLISAGRRDEAGVYLARATPVFERLGAIAELKRSREMQASIG